jgi:hypothetical protein
VPHTLGQGIPLDHPRFALAWVASHVLSYIDAFLVSGVGVKTGPLSRA